MQTNKMEIHSNNWQFYFDSANDFDLQDFFTLLCRTLEIYSNKTYIYAILITFATNHLRGHNK